MPPNKPTLESRIENLLSMAQFDAVDRAPLFNKWFRTLEREWRESVEQARQEGRKEIISQIAQYIDDRESGYDALADDSFDALKRLTARQGKGA